jgi:hypothetical protein
VKKVAKPETGETLSEVGAEVIISHGELLLRGGTKQKLWKYPVKYADVFTSQTKESVEDVPRNADLP